MVPLCAIDRSSCNKCDSRHMLHLMNGPNSLNFNVNQDIPFIVGASAQVFWSISMIRRGGITWHSIGIGGTIVFMARWIIIVHKT